MVQAFGLTATKCQWCQQRASNDARLCVTNVELKVDNGISLDAQLFCNELQQQGMM